METEEPFYRSEFVLHIGTTAGFLAEFTREYKWFQHYHRDRVIKSSKRLLNGHIQRTELGQAVTLKSVSDYAAQPSLPREFTLSAKNKQKMNNCVIVLSFKPQVVSRHVQKR